MKPYESYTDVGEEWICKIPSHWKVTKLKFLSSENVTYGINISSDNYQENGIRFIRTTDIDEFGNIIDKGVYLKKEDVEEIYLLIDGDFLISRSGTVGRAYVHQEHFGEACYAGYLVRFRFLGSQVAKYIFWFTKTTQFQLWLDFQRIESTISNVNGQKYANLSIGMPISKNEIGQIINFINSKTAQIDTLIDKKQRLIVLCQEYRTALINQAVTKGLDSKVSMKDSGIERLGEIPEQWKILKIKYVSEVIDGDRSDEYPSGEDLINSGIPFLSTKNIINNKLDFSNSRYISEDKFGNLRKGKLLAGDLIITVRGTIGAIGYFDGKDYDTAFINAQMMILRATNLLSSKYFYYFTQSNFWANQINISSYGTAQQQLSNNILQNLFISLPPINQQNTIANFLDNKLPKIEIHITKIKEQISFLKEYRSSIISHAVTGKIDVRNQG